MRRICLKVANKMFKASVLVGAICASLALVNGQSTAGPWQQCGGNGWSGPTTCVSGYTCTFSNEWYSQCLPGTGPSPTPTTTPPVSTTITPTGTQPTGQPPVVTPTLIPNHSFIRAVAAPNYRKYLRSQEYGKASDAVLGEPVEAALFRIESGQLIQNVSGGSLYAHVEPRAGSSVNKLKVSWKATPASSGTFSWSGDTLEWRDPAISRPQSNAWLVCPDGAGNKLVYVNLGPYGYQTPAGCADQTIHAYTGPSAVP